jgi:hypothetical protein
VEDRSAVYRATASPRSGSLSSAGLCSAAALAPCSTSLLFDFRKRWSLQGAARPRWRSCCSAPPSLILQTRICRLCGTWLGQAKRFPPPCFCTRAPQREPCTAQVFVSAWPWYCSALKPPRKLSHRRRRKALSLSPVRPTTAPHRPPGRHA